MNREKFLITDKDGVEKEAEVVLCFENGNPSKKYVIYTFNETDENGMVILYSSIANESGEETIFEGIENEEEWAMVKDIMKKIIVDWKE